MGNNEIKKLRLSYSKLDTYKLCPMKYKFKYIDGLGDEYTIEKPYLSFGNSVHAALKDFYKADQELRGLEFLIQCLNNNWISEGFISSEEEESYKKLSYEILEGYYKKFSDELKTQPILIEDWLSLKFDDFELIGKIDRIDSIDENSCEIIDYKTGKLPRSIQTQKEIDFQLGIYALLAKHSIKQIPRKASYYFLTFGKKVSWECDENCFSIIKDKIFEIAEKIQNDKNFYPKKNFLCPYCDFSFLCPLYIGEDIYKKFTDKNEDKLSVLMQIYTKQIKRMHFLNRLTEDLFSSLNYTELIKKTTDILRKATLCDFVIFFTPDFNKNILKVEGFSVKEILSSEIYNNLKNLSFPFFDINSESNVLIKFFNNSKIFNKAPGNWYMTKDDFFVNISKTLQKDIQNVLIIPIYKSISNAYEKLMKKFGCLVFINKPDSKTFEEGDVFFFKSIANSLAISVDNASNYKDAITDGLTGLYARRYLESRLIEERERVERYGSTFSFLMIDIDHFKNVNDTYGHQNGDIVLRGLAKIMTKGLRASDTAARYGGEEFAIILPGAQKQGIITAAERIRENVEKHEFILLDRQKIKLTVSIGCASWKDEDSEMDIVQRADDALYQAKNNGRNQVKFL